VQKTDAEWRAELSPEQYEVLRRKATERPFAGEYVDTKEERAGSLTDLVLVGMSQLDGDEVTTATAVVQAEGRGASGGISLATVQTWSAASMNSFSPVLGTITVFRRP
jgi:hypothetical protein